MRVEKAESAQKRSRGWHTQAQRAKNSVIFSLFIASNSTLPGTTPPSSVFPENFYAHKGPVDFKSGYITTPTSITTNTHTHTRVYTYNVHALQGDEKKNKNK